MPTRTRKAPKTSAVQQIKTEEVLKAVENKTPKTVNTAIVELSTSVAQELGKLQAQMTEAFAQHDLLLSAIEVRKAELERLHQIQVTAEALNELEDTRTSYREEWDREKAQRDLQWEEDEESRKKELQRIEEEYEYTTAVQRKKRQQQFEDDLAVRLRAFNTDLETRTKKLDERQVNLNAAEQELNALRQRAAAFDSEVKKLADREVAKIAAEMKKDYDTQMTVLRTRAERDLALAEQKVESAESKTEDLVKQINDLKAQLAKSQQDLKEVSTAAFDSVSGQAALAAVKDMSRTEQPAPSGRSR